MGATSTTGVSGPGDSGGKQKPANNCGCGACGDTEETTPTVPAKLGCRTKIKVSGKTIVKIGGGLGIKVC